jgi:probable rRNA maturation factor
MNLTVSWQGSDQRLDENKINKEIQRTLLNHGLRGNLELGLSLVDKKTMQKLNFKHRGHNQPTDILSFPLNLELGPDKITRLGDLVICVSFAKEQAAKIKIDLQTQVEFLISHGLLHLLGIHH